MAKVYIEREAVLMEQKTFAEYDEGGWDAAVRAVPVDAIKNFPAADVVEVVRCRDCKFWDCYGGEDSHKGDCQELELECCMYEDDFCSYGERRDEDGNKENL